MIVTYVCDYSSQHNEGQHFVDVMLVQEYLSVLLIHLDHGLPYFLDSYILSSSSEGTCEGIAEYYVYWYIFSLQQVF